MTFTISPLAKAYIFACKQARTQADLAAWMETQKPRIQQHLVPAETSYAIDEARKHWRVLEGNR